MLQKIIHIKPILLPVLLGCWFNTFAQTRDGEIGQVNDHRENVIISIDEAGALKIESRISEEVQYFNDNAKLFGEEAVSYSASFAEITDMQASTSVPTDKSNKYKKIAVTDFIKSDNRSDGVFYDDQKKISFIFPALQAGAITSFSYTKKYFEPRLWGHFLFSSLFHVKNCVYTVTAPTTIRLKYKVFGDDKSQIEFRQEQKDKNTVYTWEAHDIDKITLPKGADGIWHDEPHLIIYVESFTFNGAEHSVLRNINDLYTWYHSFTKGLEDENKDGLADLVASIVEGKSTEIEKVEAIYYWVQQNIKYIAIEDGLGGFKPRTANTVFTRRYGDCKDMSNLLYNMLGMANIQSHLTWIGTTRIPYSYEEVPTPMSSNHMICTYKNDGNYYFLDATDQYNKLGIPTTHIQGREALIDMGNNDYEIVPVPVVSPELNQVIDSATIGVVNKRISGSGKTSFRGYNRLAITNNLENLNSVAKQNFLTALLRKGNNKFSLSTANTEYLANKNHDLVINYDFTIDDYLIQNQDEILLNPHVSKDLANSYIDTSMVKTSIYYPFKNISANVLTIQIPAGYRVSYVPENNSYAGDDFSYKLDYRHVGDKLIVEQKITLNTLKITPDQFDEWNTMVKGLFSAYRESVVMQKKH
ncbi:MAG: DUF3857 and transglutaminase domain-containing protein [Cyclobacteriaceae bacterium]|nr:DUF3857 and transglutaminase domain-containing protein [Cyclobacteriaceae bacterium]